MAKSGTTKRAPDVWDSAAFSGIFLASSFSCSQALSTPAHTQVTQSVSPPVDFVDLKVLASLLSFSDFDAKYLPPYNVS